VKPWGGEEIEFEAKYAVVVSTGSEPVIQIFQDFQRQNPGRLGKPQAHLVFQNIS
jgi:hypothetical protein